MLKVINNGTEGLVPYSKYDSATEYDIHVCGKRVYEKPKYYHAETRMTFRNPTRSHFYMGVLGILSDEQEKTLYELGAKRKVGSSIHRINTDVITAMKNAGLIEKTNTGNATKWRITKIGLRFYNKNKVLNTEEYFN